VVAALRGRLRLRGEDPDRVLSENELMHKVGITTNNMHDLTPASDHMQSRRLFGFWLKGIEKRDELQGRGVDLRFPMRLGKIDYYQTRRSADS